MDNDNLYFVSTPLEIQEECYDTVIEELNSLSLSDDCNIFLKFSPLFNMANKGFFKGYIFSQLENNKDFDREPDFLIFIQ